jgi:uncharacterized membrane protein
MDDVAIARALHVFSVVLWIGGVGFVTTVLLPGVRRLRPPSERMALFDQIEQRFAWQARLTTTITGLTGFYMVYRFNLWGRFEHGGYWWMDAMVARLIFTLMLFSCRTADFPSLAIGTISGETGSDLQAY